MDVNDKMSTMQNPPKMYLDGMLVPPHPFSVPWDKHANDIRHMTLRDDDIFLCAYPKAGTHWLWEVLYMLLSGQTGYEARAKEHMMMEFSTIDRIDAQPSPRIFNTHLHFSMLPVEAMRQKKIKVLHVYRNLKDTMVSQWFHFKQIQPFEEMSLSQFVRKFLCEKEALFGTWLQYLQQTEQFMNDNPDIPFFKISFEEAKKHPVETVRRLAQFLGVEASDQLCQDIADACSFQKMKQADKDKTLPEGTIFPMDQQIYRKGEVGDWQNHLSAEDNEVLDKALAEGLKDLTKFPMQYTLDPVD